MCNKQFTFFSKQVIVFSESEFQSLKESEKYDHCSSWKITTNRVVQLSKLRKNPSYVLVGHFNIDIYKDRQPILLGFFLVFLMLAPIGALF